MYVKVIASQRLDIFCDTVYIVFALWSLTTVEWQKQDTFIMLISKQMCK